GEAREARNEVATHVAHDHRDRIAVAGWHRIQAVVSDLAQRAVAELAIAGVFGAEVVDQHGFTVYLPILGSGIVFGVRHRFWGQAPFLGSDTVFGVRHRFWGQA